MCLKWLLRISWQLLELVVNYSMLKNTQQSNTDHMQTKQVSVINSGEPHAATPRGHPTLFYNRDLRSTFSFGNRKPQTSCPVCGLLFNINLLFQTIVLFIVV